MDQIQKITPSLDDDMTRARIREWFSSDAHTARVPQHVDHHHQAFDDNQKMAQWLQVQLDDPESLVNKNLSIMKQERSASNRCRCSCRESNVSGDSEKGDDDDDEKDDYDEAEE